MQRETGRVSELLPLLQEFYREKLADLQRHERHARVVSGYDANNTYQYIVNREETELSWVAPAITDLGGEVPPEPLAGDKTDAPRAADSWKPAVEEDARAADEFVKRWETRVDAIAHARHRKMLRVILGEVLEQKRFFEQILAGRDDVLGRRDAAVGPRVGRVLSTRWIE